MNSLMYKSEYAKMYHSENRLWWYVGLRDLLRYYIGKYAPVSPGILDAGCGTGKNMEYLISLGYDDIEGFDYSANAIDFCRQRGLVRVGIDTITDIQYPDQSFEVIYCMDVLGSLDVNDREQAVAELFRVLKPGGLFLCNSAALETFRSQHDEVSNIKIRFTRAQFKSVFDHYQPEIIKLSYRVFLLSPMVFMFKLVKKSARLWNSKGESKSDQLLFPFGINWFLVQIQLIENHLLKKLNFPFGSSIFIVLKKRGRS